MEITISLKRFNRFIDDAAKLDEEYPHLNQHQWLLDNFSFDDRSATYEPAPMPWPVKDGYMSWWTKLARN